MSKSLNMMIVIFIFRNQRTRKSFFTTKFLIFVTVSFPFRDYFLLVKNRCNSISFVNFEDTSRDKAPRNYFFFKINEIKALTSAMIQVHKKLIS